MVFRGAVQIEIQSAGENMRVRESDAGGGKWENRAAKIEPHGKKAVRHAFRASKGHTHLSYMNYVA